MNSGTGGADDQGTSCWVTDSLERLLEGVLCKRDVRPPAAELPKQASNNEASTGQLSLLCQHNGTLLTASRALSSSMKFHHSCCFYWLLRILKPLIVSEWCTSNSPWDEG